MPMNKLEKKNCECEHIAHFQKERKLTPNGNPGHTYGAEFLSGIEPVKTEMGTFHVCKDCKDDCLKDWII